MDQSLIISPLLGLFVGLVMGLTGAGGGILSVPLLIFGLHLGVNQAAPISLAAVAISAVVGASLGYKAKVLRYKAAALMASFGLALAPMGIWLSRRVPNAPLTIAFGCVLLFVSYRTYLHASNELKGQSSRSKSETLCTLHESRGKLIWTLPCARLMMIAGSTAGFLSGLLGVGGGFVIVPVLRRFTNLSIESVIATSLGVLAIISSGGALIAIASGSMKWDIAIPFIVFTVLGLILGRRLIAKIHGAYVQQIFSTVTFLTAIGLLYKSIN